MTLALMAAISPAAGGEWTLDGEPGRSSHAGVEQLVAGFSCGRVSARVHLARFSEREHDIRVYDDAAGRFRGLPQVAREQGWIAGVNGGFFHPDNTPLGLVVMEGEKRHDQQRARLLSGILAANESRIHLLRPAEFALGERTRSALQAGPYLVDGGRAPAGLDADKRARRTIVATDGAGGWALGSLSALSLAEAGGLLASEAFAELLDVERALNLDGGSSSAYYYRDGDGGERVIHSLSRLRNYLGVVRR